MKLTEFVLQIINPESAALIAYSTLGLMLLKRLGFGTGLELSTGYAWLAPVPLARGQWGSVSAYNFIVCLPLRQPFLPRVAE